MTVSPPPPSTRRRRPSRTPKGELVRSASLRLSAEMLEPQDDVPITPRSRPTQVRTKSFDNRLQRSKSVRDVLGDESDEPKVEEGWDTFDKKKSAMDNSAHTMDLSRGSQLMRMRRQTLARRSLSCRNVMVSTTSTSTPSSNNNNNKEQSTALADFSQSTADTESVRSSASSEGEMEPSKPRRQSLSRRDSKRELDTSNGNSLRRSSSSRREVLLDASSGHGSRVGGSLRRSSSRREVVEGRGVVRRNSSRRDLMMVADRSTGSGSRRDIMTDSSNGSSLRSIGSKRDLMDDSTTKSSRRTSNNSRRSSSRRNVLAAEPPSTPTSAASASSACPSTRRASIRRASSSRQGMDSSDHSGTDRRGSLRRRSSRRGEGMDASSTSDMDQSLSASRSRRRKEGLIRKASRRNVEKKREVLNKNKEDERRPSVEISGNDKPTRRKSSSGRKQSLESLADSKPLISRMDEDLFTIVSQNIDGEPPSPKKEEKARLLQRCPSARSSLQLTPSSRNGLLQRSKSAKQILTSDKIKRSLSEQEFKKNSSEHCGELKVKPTSVSAEEFLSWGDGIKAVSGDKNILLANNNKNPKADSNNNNRRGSLLKAKGFSMRELVRQKSYLQVEELE